MQKQILVVDDDPLYLELVRDVFDAQEIEVLTARNGSTALSILKTHSPSLVISDYEMPGMNGMQFHSNVLEDAKTQHIPFVFMTGAAEPSLSEYAKQHGLRLLNKTNLLNELLSLSDNLK